MSRPSRAIIYLFAFLALSVLAVSVYSKISSGSVGKARLLMGTIVEIKVAIAPGEDAARARKAIDEAFAEIERIEDVFSVFKEDSELSRINKLNAGETLKISDEAFSLIERSLGYSRMTAGAFDITVGPLVELWKRAKASGTLPSAQEIESARSRVGSENAILDESAKTISFAKDGVRLDMGGIAKGYAAERAAAVLKGYGIRNAVVNAGGDIYCLGRGHKDRPWRIGVQHPRKRNETIAELYLEDRAVDTSGDYQKYFMIKDKRYSHIIDPRTGYPVGDNVVSGTVVAKDSATADAFATALCVLRPEEGLRAIKSADGVDAFIISMDGSELKTAESEGFGRYTDDHR